MHMFSENSDPVVIKESARDGLVQAAHVKTGSYRTTQPNVKLHPLEVSSGRYSEHQGMMLSCQVMISWEMTLVILQQIRLHPPGCV